MSTVSVIDQVDEEALRGLIRWHVDSGTDGLVALGTTGEASVMSTAERQFVLDIAAEETRDKMPLIVGTSSINPPVVVEQTVQVRPVRPPDNARSCAAMSFVSPAWTRHVVNIYISVCVSRPCKISPEGVPYCKYDTKSIDVC